MLDKKLISFVDDGSVVVEEEIVDEHRGQRFFIGVLLVLFALISVGQQFYFSGQRAADQRQQNKENTSRIEEIRQVQVEGRLARLRLTRLVTGISTCTTYNCTQELLKTFLREEQEAGEVPSSPGPVPIPTPTETGTP